MLETVLELEDPGEPWEIPSQGPSSYEALSHDLITPPQAVPLGLLVWTCALCGRAQGGRKLPEQRADKTK